MFTLRSPVSDDKSRLHKTAGFLFAIFIFTIFITYSPITSFGEPVESSSECDETALLNDKDDESEDIKDSESSEVEKESTESVDTEKNAVMSLKNSHANTEIKRGITAETIELKELPSAEASIVNEINPYSTIQGVQVSNNWYVGRYQNANVYYKLTDSTFIPYTATNEDIGYGAIIGGKASITKLPRESSEEVLSLSEGTTIKFIEFNESYYVAKYNNELVFIPKNKVKLYNPKNTKIESGYVGVNEINLYAAPDKNAEVLKTLPINTEVYLMDFAPGWYVAKTKVNNIEKIVFFLADDIVERPIPRYEHAEYTNYDISLDEIIKRQDARKNESEAAKEILQRQTLEALRKYMDPKNQWNGLHKYQFMRLDRTINASEQDLNAMLENAGILKDQGAAFKNVSNKYQINEVYLVFHTIHETGYGNSNLACRAYWNPVTNTASKTPKPGFVRVYNFYGIGATDQNTFYNGTKRAYEQGWTTPEKAIEGGAEWINSRYIRSGTNTLSGQNTLYKMLYHPEALATNSNKKWHQYASDPGWAAKQSELISEHISLLTAYTINYDVPKYR